MNLVVEAPATAANLGPAFDALAMALDLANRFELDTEAPASVVVDGEGADELPEDDTNLVLRTIAHVGREAGVRLPSFGLRCHNAIPLQRGLGSSAAAVVGGLLLAEALLDVGMGPDRLLETAVDLEGHADNVAACLRGGLVLAYRTGPGWRAESMACHPSLRPVLLVPLAERVATTRARRVLPGQVPLGDAAFNAGRSALVLLALTARPRLLREALDDRLHQPYRLPLAPAAEAMFAGLRERGVPVCLAGSGPTLLAFEDDEHRVGDPGAGWRVLRPAVRAAGAGLVRA